MTLTDYWQSFNVEDSMDLGGLWPRRRVPAGFRHAGRDSTGWVARASKDFAVYPAKQWANSTRPNLMAVAGHDLEQYTKISCYASK
jgi:hypothetical protein